MEIDEPQDGLYCHYPPRVADEVEVTERDEAGTLRFVVKNSATFRYFLLKPREYQVFRQFNGSLTVPEIAGGGAGASGPRIPVATLIKFLTKLDSLGLLARSGVSDSSPDSKPERGLYIRFRLFNPNRLLERLDRAIGWALTGPYIVASFALMVIVALGMMARANEVAAYTSHIYAEYGLAAIIIITLAITVSHEVAHGLACKHFGGDVREMGVLMIYYVFPGLYCNVTDIYRIGRRRERLWVIFAGIYWQLLVSALGGLFWLAATPYTLLADFSLLLFLGGSFNIAINCNPLIKLDGYYALSQALGIQNLQVRSSEYVQSLVGRVIGDPQAKRVQSDRATLFINYWLCSILYSAVLVWLILGWAGAVLMDELSFAGVLLTLLLAFLLTEKWWKPVVIRFITIVRAVFVFSKSDRITTGTEGVSTMSAQPGKEKAESKNENLQNSTSSRMWPSRHKVFKGALVVALLLAIFAPWEASTGSDCTLLLPPGREGVARANTDAVLSEIYVHPGDAIAEGARIARLYNPEIEDRLTQLNGEIDRLNTANSRIEEELRVRSENMLSANFKELEHKRLANELKSESGQIAAAGVGGRVPGVEESDSSISARSPAPETGSLLPPSLAVLQSQIELKQTELEHNRRESDRYKKLSEQGLIGAQQYDRAVAAMRVSEKELQGARARFEAALIEHRRQTNGAQTNSLVAETEARAARSYFESLIAELHANRQQMESHKQRRDILQREYDAMNIVSPRTGVVLGDDMQKMVGRRYTRGEEICRIGELERFLLRIEVNEREIGNVRLQSMVRFKLKTVPGRTFSGQVSKINAEPISNQYGQHFYPVEVLVENSDGLLRPGMTGFARISFGRQSIGLILAQKLWHALRPELWLF